MIELRQLYYFAAAAWTLHFCRAAERLHIAQPALSVQIKAPEQTVGRRRISESRQNVTLD
jgi:DNA-binding transcriptional LysR family regulator